MTIKECAKSAQLKFRKLIYSAICNGKNCRNIFFTLHKQQKFCKEGCYHSSKIEECICEFCKHNFKRHANANHKISKKHFCGTRCYRKYNHGTNHSAYRGKNFLNKKGYKTIVVNGKSIKEHTHIMENHIGRKLKPFENVHHKNGIRHDNRISNLELWTRCQPYGQRIENLLEFCVKNYKKELLSMIHASA